MARKAQVVRTDFPPGRRVLAISDIHGNAPFFRGVLEAARYTPEDILVLVGDLLEKGPDSLELLELVMDLARRNTVYCLRGNCDDLVWDFAQEERSAPDGFFRHYLEVWGERSALVQMGRAVGCPFRGAEDIPALRQAVRRSFGPQLAFLEAMPEILLTPDYLFVHGGVPGEDNLEGLDAWGCMKNDDFLAQGYAFRRWCIVGHWPVTLYHTDAPTARPLLLEERHIASIDGGCSLQLDGQLNALELPRQPGAPFVCHAYDGLPTAVALDSQAPSENPVNVRWGGGVVEVLEWGEPLSRCRHLESGRELEMLTDCLSLRNGEVWCQVSTDYRLPVAPGDRLSVVRRLGDRALVKKNGVTGWYFGRLEEKR